MPQVHPMSVYGRFQNLSGKTFGRWTVLSYAGLSRVNRCTWNCRCQCGVEKVVRADKLNNRESSSCGCRQRDVVGARNLRHGKSKTAEYRIWKAMHTRCGNPNILDFADYGGRGIQVCERWVTSFENFLADMGLRPTPKHSIDRIDVDGPYSPENCRWATPKQQTRNARSNRLYTFQGETLCIGEWAERTSIKYHTLLQRFNQGWSPKRALTEPVRR
jgi:hypothetical protein